MFTLTKYINLHNNCCLSKSWPGSVMFQLKCSWSVFHHYRLIRYIFLITSGVHCLLLLFLLFTEGFCSCSFHPSLFRQSSSVTNVVNVPVAARKKTKVIFQINPERKTNIVSFLEFCQAYSLDRSSLCLWMLFSSCCTVGNTAPDLKTRHEQSYSAHQQQINHCKIGHETFLLTFLHGKKKTAVQGGV